MDTPDLPRSKPDIFQERRNRSRSKDSRAGAHTLHVLPGDKSWELYPTNAEKRAINYWDKSLHDVVMSAGALSLLVAMFTVISLNLQSSRANYWATILQGSHTFAPTANTMAQSMMRWATRLFVSCLALCMLVACLALCAKHQLTKHQWQAQGNGSAHRLSHVTWRQRVVIARLRRSGMPSIIAFLWRLLSLAFLMFCLAVVLFLLPLDLMLSGVLLGVMLLVLIAAAISVVLHLYQRETPLWMPILTCRELSAEISDMKPMNRGMFSTVHKGVLKRDDKEELVAVKEIRTKGMDPGVVSRRFRREIRVWSTLKHRYILPIYGVHIGSNDELPALVSPWCIKGNLNDYIKERRRGNDPMIDLCLVKLKEVLNAIIYLHGQNPPIVHGDLKGNNILVAMDGRIQLADFGLSLIQADHGNLMSTDPVGKGTLPFMSCELLEHETPTVHSDMWALSCVFVEMVSGSPPYHDKPSNKGKTLAILSGEFPARPDGVSDELWALVSINWNKNPLERMSAESMLSRLLMLEDDPGHRSMQNLPK